MDVLSVVVGALNTGFLATLKLFFVTLVGALPLGLVIAFGSMNRWAPFAWLAHGYLRRKNREPGRIAQQLISFMPIRLVCRLVVWRISGVPRITHTTRRQMRLMGRKAERAFATRPGFFPCRASAQRTGRRRGAQRLMEPKEMTRPRGTAPMMVTKKS